VLAIMQDAQVDAKSGVYHALSIVSGLMLVLFVYDRGVSFNVCEMPRKAQQ